LYSVRDVALRLGIAEGTVRKYLREGKMLGRKHAGAWHVTEESFRAFLRQTGDDLRPEDVPQLVVREVVHEPEPLTAEPAPPPPSRESELPHPALNETQSARGAPLRPQDIDELEWMIREAKRLKAEARRLEQRYIDPNLPDVDLSDE
jgi:hypothetical protein